MELHSPAGRLHSILARAAINTDKRSGGQHWAAVFSIPSEDMHAMHFQVAQRLVWMGDELEVMVDYLRTVQNYPEQGYASIRNAILNATSPQLIGLQADKIAQHLRPQVLSALEQIAFHSPQLEEPIDSDQLKQFADLVDEIERGLNSSPVGPVLAAVLRRHVELLRRALDAYPIWGIRAFADSLRDAYGDLSRFRDGTLKDLEPSEESLKALAERAWVKAYWFVDVCEKAKKTLVWIGYGATAVKWLHDLSN